VRDFITVLNLHQQNPQIAFSQLIHSSNFNPTSSDKNPDVEEDSKFAEFTL
jgi:hypothetical protein